MIALMEGIIYLTNLDLIFAGIIAFVTIYIAIIGTILGIYGSIMVWERNLSLALLLFFWLIPITIFFYHYPVLRLLTWK